MTKTLNQNVTAIETKHSEEERERNLFTIILGGIIFSFIWMFFDPNIAHAVTFDVDKAGSALFVPLLKFVDDYGPAGIFISGVGGMIAMPGDMKTKALAGGTGMGLSALTIWAVQKGFGMGAA